MSANVLDRMISQQELIELVYTRIHNNRRLNAWACASQDYLHHIQAPLVDGISMGYSRHLELKLGDRK